MTIWSTLRRTPASSSIVILLSDRCSLFARQSESAVSAFRFLPEYDSNDFILILPPPFVSPARLVGRRFKQCHRQPDQRHQCPHPTIRLSTLLSQCRDQFFCERSQSCSVDLYSSDARLFFLSGMSCLTHCHTQCVSYNAYKRLPLTSGSAFPSRAPSSKPPHPTPPQSPPKTSH